MNIRVEEMSVRLSLIVFTLAIVTFQSPLFAQFMPGSYTISLEQLSKLKPGDEGYDTAQRIVQSFESELRTIFHQMPTIRPMVVVGWPPSTPPNWKTKVELELRQSGIGIANENAHESATLILAVGRSSDGKWKPQFSLTELVVSPRPGGGQIRCKTYEKVFRSRNTRGDAEEEVSKALEEFCLLYMKFSGPTNTDQGD